jgi:hypothetical protein
VRAWLSIVTIAVVAAVPLNLAGTSLASLPAPGDLPSERAGVSLHVVPSVAHAGQVVRVDTTGTWAIVYSIDEQTRGDWINRFVAPLGSLTGEPVEPFRPKKDMFWTADAGFGSQDVRVDIAKLDEGTYRIRKAFFTGSDSSLKTFELAAVFTVE